MSDETERRRFVAQDRLLDLADSGPQWLRRPDIAECVTEALALGESIWKKYSLSSWVVMPNHVHVLLTPKVELWRVTKSVKSYSARRANEILGRTGKPFLQDESYDHWVRSDDELNRIIRYIEWNPVKAGLAERIQDWPHSSATAACGAGR